MREKCRYCDHLIQFVQTPNGGRMPVEAEPVLRILMDQGSEIGRVVRLYEPHWANCPGANQARIDAKARKEHKEP